LRSRGRAHARNIAISMSRIANPYDNAKAEEVNGKAYATLDQARRDIGAFIETVYNTHALTRRAATNRRLSSKPNLASPATA
jgi:putative transposase